MTYGVLRYVDSGLDIFDAPNGLDFGLERVCKAMKARGLGRDVAYVCSAEKDFEGRGQRGNERALANYIYRTLRTWSQGWRDLINKPSRATRLGE